MGDTQCVDYLPQMIAFSSVFFPVCVSNSLLFTLDLDAFNLLIFKTMFHHPQLLKDSDFSFHLI